MAITPLESGMQIRRVHRHRRQITAPARDRCIEEIRQRLRYGAIWLSQQSDKTIRRLWRQLHHRKPRSRHRYTKLTSVSSQISALS